jgi:hypothetical protein
VKRTEFQGIISELRYQHHSAAAFLVTCRPGRNSADLKHMDRVVHGSESVSIVTEVQSKVIVNFNSLHLLQIEKFDNCALLKFHPQ